MFIDPCLVDQLTKDRGRYRKDKTAFDREVCKFKPSDQQIEANIIYIEFGKIIIKSGTGTGKTRWLASCVFHQLYCYEFSTAPCTAPTQHQLNDILWTELARIMQKAPILQRFFILTKTKLYVRGHENLWFASAIASSNPDNVSGLHDENMLFSIEEAPGINEATWEVIEGTLTQEHNKVIMIGNPVKSQGHFYNTYQTSGNGWGKLTLSSIDSGVPHHNPNYHINIAKRFGENSNVYRVRVLGEFPTQEDDSILSIDLVNAAMERDKPLKEDTFIKGACDAARFGDDRTVLKMRIGYEEVDEVIYQGKDTVWTQNAIVQQIRKWNPSEYMIDEGTFGAGIIDNVRRILDGLHIVCDVVGIYFNAKAVNPRQYFNAVSEMYFNLQEVLKYAKIKKCDEALGELTMRKYYIDDKTQTLRIQSKDDLRKLAIKMRLPGFNSPDLSDTYGMLWYNSRSAGKDQSAVYVTESKYDMY